MDARTHSRIAGAFDLRRQRRGRYVRGWPGFPVLLACALACMALVVSAAGCGGPSENRAEEEVVVEKALQTALGGERVEFVRLVAPSFLAQVRAEMPDTSDDTLGGVLIAGFTEGIPFEGVAVAEYDIEVTGEDRAAVYVWGSFLDGSGAEIRISEAEALRIPLVRENSRWYIDLLDL